jgi:hypothetical protein
MVSYGEQDVNMNHVDNSFGIEDAKQEFPLSYIDFLDKEIRHSVLMKQNKRYYFEQMVNDSATPFQLYAKIPRGYGSIVKSLRREIKEQIFWYQDKQRASLPYSSGKRDDVEFMEKMLNMVFIDGPMEELLEKLRYLEKYAQLCKEKPDEEQENWAKKLEQAKAVPIDTILEFRGNKRLCIWHNEQTPSMIYNKHTNKVHCFGCNKGGDSVDVVMNQSGCTFREAVKQLT